MVRQPSSRSPRPSRRTARSPQLPAPQRLLLTGADSLVGTRLLRLLLDSSHEVVAITRQRAEGTIPPGVIRVVAERTSPAWHDWMAGCSAAVHVGPGLGERPADENRCEGVGAADTAALVAACARQGVGRVVLVSCLGAAADAPGSRQRAAWAAEEAIRRSHLAWTILRPAWMADAGPSLPARLGERVRHGRVTVLFGGGDYPLPLVAAADVARIALLCLDDQQTVGRVFDLVSGPMLSLLELIRRIAATVGRPARFLTLPSRWALFLPATVWRRPGRLFARDELLSLWRGATGETSQADAIFGPLVNPLAPPRAG